MCRIVLFVKTLTMTVDLYLGMVIEHRWVYMKGIGWRNGWDRWLHWCRKVQQETKTDKQNNVHIHTYEFLYIKSKHVKSWNVLKKV